MHATEYSNASRTHALQHPRARAGTTRCSRELACRARCCPRCAIRAACSARRTRSGSAPRFRSRASRATSRPRCSGRAATAPGRAKNTYGTGCFLLDEHGRRWRRARRRGPAHDDRVGRRRAASSTRSRAASSSTGAAVQWLRDGLRPDRDAAESEAARAPRSTDTGGVYLVPAFAGLGAPYWDERARGTLVGITRGTTREHLVRATLEAIAYQTRDVVECVRGRRRDRARCAARRRRRRGATTS